MAKESYLGKIFKDYFSRFDRIYTLEYSYKFFWSKKLLFYDLCLQDVTEIIDDVAELFKELIVRKPLGVFLDNAMEQHFRRNSAINFTLPMVNFAFCLLLAINAYV